MSINPRSSGGGTYGWSGGVPEKRALLLEAVRKLGTLDPVRDVFGGKIQPMPIPRDLRHALPHRRPENRWKRRCHYRADLYVKFKTCLVPCAVGAIRPTDVEEHGILSGVEKWAVKFDLRRCAECGASFADRDGCSLCPACRRLREELKEIFGPHRDVAPI